ncbi:putative Ig-like domain-containing protein [Seiridium cardinale]
MFTTFETTMLALAISALHVQAQFNGKGHLYSVKSCPPKANNLNAQSLDLSWSAKKKDGGKILPAWLRTIKEAGSYTECNEATINLPDWPTTEDGKFPAWFDTSSLGDGCSMLFYNLLDSNEETDRWSCGSLYRQAQKDSTECADLDLTGKFGYAYCCGKFCNHPIETWPGIKQRDNGDEENHEKREPARDVTAVKRSPILQERKDCKIKKTGDVFTTYGDQRKMGPGDTCEKDQTTCGQDYTYTVGREVSSSVNFEGSVTVGVDEFVVATTTLSAGWEKTTTQQKSFSTTKHIAPEPGHTGYPTFQPLYICSKVTVQGNCGDSIKDGLLCVPKFLPNNIPDGHWSIVTTD